MSVATAPGQNIKVLSDEFRKYWDPLIPKTGVYFTAKAAYRKDVYGTPNEPMTNFFENELTRGDVYVELLDIGSYDPLFPGFRTLHKFGTTDYTVRFVKAPNGTFIVPLQAMVQVNQTDIKAPQPIIIGAPVKVAAPAAPSLAGKFSPAKGVSAPVSTYSSGPLPEEPISYDDELFPSDDNSSKMTIRDWYCIIQNVPFSNKGWLNQLIETGTAYKNLPSHD